MIELSDDDYLKMFQIGHRKYLIGVYQDGITVYKQQIRALNIFYLLLKTGRINLNDKDFTIGIVGGGVAGLTFAAAALKAGIKVRIFERQKVFLHMQSGCDIRTIHPNIYEWPERKSLFPYAELPIMTWRHDTASNVVKRLLSEFESVKKSMEAKRKNRKRDWFEEYRGCVIDDIVEEDGALGEKIVIKTSKPVVVNESCNLVIFAVGYGIEKGIKGEALSYWRNDPYGQPILTDKEGHTKHQEFIVSGVGDGGLVDLFRLSIRGFSFPSFLQFLMSQKTRYKKLVSVLLKIKKDGRTQLQKPKFLHQELSKINKDLYEYIYDDYILPNLSENITIILNSTEKYFDQALKFESISMLNAFLAFILEKFSVFKYKGGVISHNRKTNKYYFDGLLHSTQNTCVAIIRHGTHRDSIFKGVRLSAQDLKNLKIIKKKQKESVQYGQIAKRWTFNDLNKYFTSDLQKYAEKKFEFYTSETVAICSSFISIVASVINSLQKNKDKNDFRASLHRVVNVGDSFYFQQITPYFGTTNKGGAVGQIHPLSRGNVGLSIITGKPILIQNENHEETKEILKLFNLEEDYNEVVKNNSFLTIPILAKLSDGDLATNLVIFIDSKQSSFFNQSMIELIVSTAKGFVDSVQRMLEEGQISMGELDFDPLRIDQNAALYKRIKRFKSVQDLTSYHKDISPRHSILTFKNFYTFDVYNK